MLLSTIQSYTLVACGALLVSSSCVSEDNDSECEKSERSSGGRSLLQSSHSVSGRSLLTARSLPDMPSVPGMQSAPLKPGKSGTQSMPDILDDFQDWVNERFGGFTRESDVACNKEELRNYLRVELGGYNNEESEGVDDFQPECVANIDIWHRPLWYKPQRCIGPDPASCSECLSEYPDQKGLDKLEAHDHSNGGRPRDCWGPWWNGQPVIQVKVSELDTDGNPKFARHRSAMTFQCPSVGKVMLAIQAEYFDGNLIVWKNGRLLAPTSQSKVTHENTGRLADFDIWRYTLDSAPSEIMTLTVDFLPNAPEARAEARINFKINKEFARCQDNMVCLNMDTSDQDFTKLREILMDNAMQDECLKGRLKGVEACDLWVDCLAEKGTFDALRAMVAASQTPRKPRLNLLEMPLGKIGANNSRNADRQDADECLLPTVEDPKSWACNCHADMEGACEFIQSRLDETVYSLEKCFTAMYCYAKQVCTSWKDEVSCDQGDLLRIQEEIPAWKESNQGGLLQRASHAEYSSGSERLDVDAVDHSLGAKTCV